jgi:hypothetical protein
MRMAYRPLTAAVLCSISISASAAHTFNETGLLDDKLQVRIEPKYSSGNLIGIDVYELWPEDDVGHAFLSKRSYYRFDTQRVTEDRDWYYVKGLIGDKTLEIENRYETQHWSITQDLASGLDRAARLAANPKASVDELRKLYRSLRGAFTVKAGETEREGKSQWKWLSGLQRIGDVEIILDRSQKFGNRYNAKFAN